MALCYPAIREDLQYFNFISESSSKKHEEKISITRTIVTRDIVSGTAVINFKATNDHTACC